MKGSIFVTKLPSKKSDGSYEYQWIPMYSGVFDAFNDLLGKALAEHLTILELVREMEIISQINLYELSDDDFNTLIRVMRRYIKDLTQVTAKEKIALSIWTDQIEELIQKDPRYQMT